MNTQKRKANGETKRISVWSGVSPKPPGEAAESTHYQGPSTVGAEQFTPDSPPVCPITAHLFPSSSDYSTDYLLNPPSKKNKHQ
jgi:hypothetical protein